MAVAADWGDVPTWLSSIATILALLFAALAALAAQRVYRIESKRDQVAARARQEQEAFVRRTQAALVSAWWGWGLDGWGAFVRNASETPVYQVGLTVLDIHDPDVGERIDLPIVPPAAEPIFHRSELGTGLVADGRHAVDYRVEVTFTDSAGVRWIRDQMGRLSELRPEVLIWADGRRANALGTFAADFLATHGVRLRFHTEQIERLQRRLVDGAEGDEVPDVVVGPHDWVGDLAQRGLIEPLALSQRRRQAFLPAAVTAMTWNGELYGVPYALDTAVLLRNTDLAPEQPATFEELLATGVALRAAGRADEALVVQVGAEGDPYYMYPLLLAAGGWLFGRDAEGRPDPRRLGVTAPETIAAFERFRGLGAQGSGVLRREIDKDRATALFAAGRAPYLVCASRVVSDARRAGVPFVVGPVPPYEGQEPVRPFVSVHGFFLTRRGRNKTIAQDLAAHYLTRTDVALSLYDTQPRPPALRSALDEVVDRDPTMAAFYAECRAGDLMPSLPQMRQVWTALGKAEVELVAGAATDPVVRRLAHALQAALPAAELPTPRTPPESGATAPPKPGSGR
ncbi:extracellular solute-binding protein [Phytohabitans sp. ZYX-F-186]|uniref:Extracellular solute-binding protein n=1 Tax=Phytohabitans maris TaxID=3071409 RepID=A0ABU0ZS52_9ACTN|nr:extracellular solute-binding protein [Phytohabitans sp. ZYX-F-186]MDQ7909317.1 extracellular solute-binding protein [Phytohabitans sp. ZYX-F-186]